MPLFRSLLLPAAVVATAATVVIVAGGALTARAGTLDRPEVTDYRVWESTRCYKPRAPNVQITDAVTFNLAVEGFNQYMLHMRRYLECAEQEANEDYASLKRVLEQGLALVRSDSLRDLQDARENIEQFRSLYAPEPQNGETATPPPSGQN
ncbi:MAG: hypothetical protein H6844_02885 [Alphaproteobacteria bacterium]|nr:hypothetical protein [Alphaproteobacteria bacterium]